MKLTTIIIMAAFLQVSAATLAQKVTINQKQATLQQIFTAIHEQTGYNVLWSGSELKGLPAQDVHFKDAPFQEVLETVLKDQPLTYVVQDKTVLIKEKEPSFLDNLKNKITSALAPPVSISGTMQDETGQPLPGVTIKIKNTDVGVISRENGRFSLSVPNNNAILVFSFIGYETQELAAKDIANNAVITLKAVATNLHEVVVNKGYNVEREELSTGNVSIVTAKEIEQQPVPNPLEALAGRVPGVIISQTSGVPGGAINIQIRGKNSLTNGTDPFYVIDGVPYSSELPGNLLNPNLVASNNTTHNIYTNNSQTSGNPLNYINPDDIESIEVLKDADATAIYGTRGANGVILITTKKGKAGTMKANFNVQSGVTSPAHDVQLLNTQQYLQMRHEAFKNDGATPGPGDHDINGDWDTTRYTDWTKVLMQNGHYTNATGSVSGGTTNTQYLVGGSYYRQSTGFPSLTENDGADQKASAHFNINTSSTDKKFKMSLTGSYVSDINTVTPVDIANLRLETPPDAPPLYNPDGSLNWAPLVPGQPGTWGNPLAAFHNTYKQNTSNLVSNMLLSYELLPGLNLRSSIGYTNTQTDEVLTYPTTDQDPGTNPTSGQSQFNEMNTHSWIIEPQMDYEHKLGKGKFSALIGASFQENNQSANTLSASGFTSDAQLGNAQAASKLSSTNAASEYKYQAIYARLNYNLEDKYLLNLTGRRDGTSRFGPGKQFGNFGAAGGAWIFSKEDFIQKTLPFLSFGKLRASYGTTGSDQVGDYKFLDLYNPTQNPYQGSKGIYPQNLFNPDLSWETTKKLEGGIELGFLKDRITIEASFYRNRSSNELVTTPISVVTGYSSIPANLPATVQNSGQEYMLNTINIKSKDFTWSSSFNLTIARNKLVAFPNLASSPYSSTYIIGKPITIIEEYRYAGVNPTTGLYQFYTENGSVTSNPSYPGDAVPIVLSPSFTGGFINTITYKGISLDFLFQFVKQKGESLWGAYDIVPGNMYNQPVNVLNRWQKPGDQKPVEQFTQNSGSAAHTAFQDAALSNYAFGDASYIRLKNASLSWNLPKNWRQSLHLENCRFYVQGENLLTFTKYNGIDPETMGYGTPPYRVWTMGFQVGF